VKRAFLHANQAYSVLRSSLHAVRISYSLRQNQSLDYKDLIVARACITKYSLVRARSVLGISTENIAAKADYSCEDLYEKIILKINMLFD